MQSQETAAYRAVGCGFERRAAGTRAVAFHLPNFPGCPCSRLLTRVWGNDIFIGYLRTGEFDWNPLPW